MKAAAFSIRHSFLLFQLGALLFLFALLVGFLVSKFPVPRLGLSAHLLGVMQALFLILLGVLWPKLDLSQAASRLGVALALYGCFAAWLANVLAAVWGAGNSMLPLAAGAAHGSTLQELTIALGLRSAAAALVALSLFLLWALQRARAQHLRLLAT